MIFISMCPPAPGFAWHSTTPECNEPSDGASSLPSKLGAGSPPTALPAKVTCFDRGVGAGALPSPSVKSGFIAIKILQFVPAIGAKDRHRAKRPAAIGAHLRPGHIPPLRA